MIYYDITDLISYFSSRSHVTGIQRVTLTIIREFIALAEINDDLRLMVFHKASKKPMTTSADFFKQEDISGEMICSHFGLASARKSDALSEYVERRYARKWLSSFHCKRLQLKNWLTRGRTFRSKGILQSHADPRVESKAVWKSAHFETGSVIYISGTTWANVEYLQSLARWRAEHKIKFVQLVYDLIPVMHSEFMPNSISFMFEDWLLELNKTADMILTNAQTTQRDLVAFAEQAKLPAYTSIRVVPLAHEFVGSRQSAELPALGANARYAKIRTPVLQAARLPYVLCVGTLEIRKNNWGVAQVWEKLGNKLGYELPRLIFAGRKGWHNEEFHALLERTDNLGGYVVTLDDVSDDELSYLYKNCLFSIFPSFAEGWGLPIGESLWFGRPVITSSVSSMPEVAGRYADYIDPYDLTSLEKGVVKMLDKNYREARAEEIKSMPLRTWKDVAKDIWEALHSI